MSYLSEMITAYDEFECFKLLNSGGIYCAVPIECFDCYPKSLASPKSHIEIYPSSDNKIFSNLISKCAILR